MYSFVLNRSFKYALRATYVIAMETKCELTVTCIVALESTCYACCVRLIMPLLRHLIAVTLPRYSLHSYHRTNQDTERVKRNPTIRISRATRVVESNASLDREITNWKELRNLDEFLGNQVRTPPRGGEFKAHFSRVDHFLFIYLFLHEMILCLNCTGSYNVCINLDIVPYSISLVEECFYFSFTLLSQSIAIILQTISSSVLHEGR